MATPVAESAGVPVQPLLLKNWKVKVPGKAEFPPDTLPLSCIVWPSGTEPPTASTLGPPTGSVAPLCSSVVTVGLTLFTAVKHSFVVTELTLGEYCALASGVYSTRKQ